MPLDVGPPRTPRFGSPVVLSRAHWVRRSRVLAFGRTKVAASSEAGRPKAESSIRLVAMRKPVGAWSILDQIKPGGRIVLPLGPDEAQRLTVVDKGADGQTSVRKLIQVRFSRLETVV